MVERHEPTIRPGEPLRQRSEQLLGPRASEAVFVASFSEFYNLYHQKIAASLALNFGDTELGTEAADEAMARAYERWGVVSGHDNPAGWVYRVGLNWGRSWFRRAGRRLPWLDRNATELPETADPALRRALLNLEAKHREVVVCRYYLDWSTLQTAAALEIPTGTVKSRLHQALSRLRTELEPTDDPGAWPVNDTVNDTLNDAANDSLNNTVNGSLNNTANNTTPTTKTTDASRGHSSGY